MHSRSSLSKATLFLAVFYSFAVVISHHTNHHLTNHTITYRNKITLNKLKTYFTDVCPRQSLIRHLAIAMILYMFCKRRRSLSKLGHTVQLHTVYSGIIVQPCNIQNKTIHINIIIILDALQQ